jgi:hypothetical protein
MDPAEQLISLQHEGWRALVAGNGGDCYRKYLTEDPVMAFPSGTVTREAALEATEAVRPWERSEIRDPQLIELGHGTGVAVYSVLARRPGDEPYAVVVSSTFVRDHDR